MSRLPSRLALKEWLTAQGHAPEALEALAGDVSPRRYLRVRGHEGESTILVYYPATVREIFSRFLATTSLLEDHDVPVPRILASDAASGLMLLEDAGRQTLFDRPLSWPDRLPLLSRATDLCARIAALPRDRVQALNPAFDRALIERELDLTWRAFIEPRLPLSDRLKSRLRGAFEALRERLFEAPLEPCHRDLMARNLLLRDDDRQLVVIDHQDLRLGPPLYDLASLFNDSLYPPPAIVDSLLGELLATPLLRLRYHRAAAQRTFKILGTFSRFAELGSPRYLPLLRPTLERFTAHLKHLPEGEAVATELEEHLTNLGVKRET